MGFRILDGSPSQVIYVKAGTGGLTAGGLAVITGSGVSATAIKATAAVTASTLLGIARESVAAGAYTSVELIGANHWVEADYTGSSKTSVVDTDALAIFDISDEKTVNLDDTTGGCFVAGGCGTNFYDNTNKKIRGYFTAASRLI